jgi:hypothetical protein
MREIRVICDECGAETVGEGWPSGWYHWHQRDLCHDCAVPKIIEALSGCPDESPVPIYTVQRPVSQGRGRSGSQGSSQ